MPRSSGLLAGIVALMAACAAAAQEAPSEERRAPPAVAPTDAVPWTSVPRRVERREPTIFVPAPENVNVPLVAPPQPAAARPAIAAATQGSAVLEVPESGETTFHRATVIDPGSFQAGDVPVRLAGIVPLSIDEHCPGPSGEAWPCGRRALAALRDLVRQRPIHCVETGRDGDTLIARCRVGRTDVAAWLIERGWARPLGGNERLQRLSQAAREARVGQFAAQGAGAPP